MAPRKFSLAAALWDFPQADDCAAPTQRAPDTWRVLFESEHTDSDVWPGVHSSCKRGRDWALRAAPRAIFTVDCTQDNEQLSKQLAAVERALATRGERASALVLAYDRSGSSQEAVVMAAQTIAEFRPKPNITALKIKCLPMYYNPAQIMPDMIQRTSAALPSITSLTIEGCGGPLPPRTRLPNLKHLDLSQATHNVYPTVAPFTQQLTSIKLPLLLYPQAFTTTTHTLTHISTGGALDGTLVAVLLAHAPAVTHLSVFRGSDSYPRLPEFADKDWLVEELCFTSSEHMGVYASNLEWLPRHKEGQVLTIKAPPQCTIRLPWKVRGPTVCRDTHTRDTFTQYTASRSGMLHVEFFIHVH